MLWYAAWYVILEFLSLVPVFCVFLAIYPLESFINIKQQKAKFLLQPIKLFFWAFLTLSVFNGSFLFSRPWRYMVILLLVLTYVLCLIFLIFKLKKTRRANIIKVLTPVFRQYIDVFIIGFITFIILTWLRGLNPDLISTEKPMDFSFIKSFLRQDYLPFINPWLSNVFLNYYYLGQFWVSILSFLSFFSIPVVYNLVVGLIAALGLQVVYEFFKYFVGGDKKISLILSFVIVFSGNMGYIVYILKHFLNSSYHYYYPNPTRIIPHTINEYPAYSVLLADLHGHYLMLPFVWATVILIIYIEKTLFILIRNIISKQKGKNVLIYLNQLVVYFFMVAFLIPFIFGGNSWDILNLFIFIVITLMILLYIVCRNNSNSKRFIQIIYICYRGIKNLFVQYHSYFWGMVSGVFLLLANALPFFSIYIPPGGKLSFIWPPAIGDIKYYPLLWGQIVLYGLVVAVIIHILKTMYTGTSLKGSLRVGDLFNAYILIGVALTGIVLIVLTQFLYVQDIFHIANPPYFRANTLFKIYYTAWYFMLLGLFGSFIFAYTKLKIWFKKSRNSMRVLSQLNRALLLLAFIFLGYFIVGIQQRFFYVSKEQFVKKLLMSLDTNYINGLLHDNPWFNSNELKVVSYLGKLDFYSNIIVEPVSYDSYSMNAKYCIYSGSQCFLGWPLHNMQWYGGWEGQAYACRYQFSPSKEGNTYKPVFSRRNKIQINLQQRIAYINDIYSNNPRRIRDGLHKLITHYKEDFQSMHILIYKNKIVPSPDIQASLIYRILQDSLLCTKFKMIHIGQVYDITCK